jgi:hypothetical protein
MEEPRLLLNHLTLHMNELEFFILIMAQSLLVAAFMPQNIQVEHEKWKLM